MHDTAKDVHFFKTKVFYITVRTSLSLSESIRSYWHFVVSQEIHPWGIVVQISPIVSEDWGGDYFCKYEDIKVKNQENDNTWRKSILQ